MKRFMLWSIVVMLFCAGECFGTWVKQTSGTAMNLYDVWFKRPPSGRGWAVGAGGTILSTQNMGTNWVLQTSPTNQTLYGVAWDPKYLFAKEWATAVGSDTGGGLVIHTTNSGNTWTVKLSSSNIVYAVSYGDSTNGWAVGSAGSVWRTIDGGQTWVFQTTTLRVNWLGVWFVNSVLGWKCGTNGAIMKTTNGGANWQTQTSGVPDTLRGICFRDSLLGCAVGDNGVILRTNDGGSSWNQITTGYTENLHGVFLSPLGSLGYAVGTNGRILATSNGGASWVSQASGVTHTLRGVWCWLDLPGQWGFAVGDSGTILYQFIPSGVVEGEADARCSIHDAGLKIYPNPFRDKTDIRCTMHDARYRIEESRGQKPEARLRIYDASGRLVKSFDLGSLLVTHRSLLVTWDGRDDQGVGLAPGVYFVSKIPLVGKSEDRCTRPVRIVKLK